MRWQSAISQSVREGIWSESAEDSGPWSKRKTSKQIKSKNQDLYSVTETLVTWWFILTDTTVKGTQWSPNPQGSLCRSLCQLLKWVSHLLQQASYGEMLGFLCLEVFFSLSHCFPLKALLLGNRELFQSLKFKVHFMKSPFLVYASDGRGY